MQRKEAPARKQSRWTVGSFAEHESRVGKLIIDPNRDNEVRLEYADDGTESNYVNVTALSKTTAADFKKARGVMITVRVRTSDEVREVEVGSGYKILQVP